MVLRKGMKALIKCKKASIRNIERHIAEDPEDAEVTEIRRRMIATREDTVAHAQSILADLDHITAVEG